MEFNFKAIVVNRYSIIHAHGHQPPVELVFKDESKEEAAPTTGRTTALEQILEPPPSATISVYLSP